MWKNLDYQYTLQGVETKLGREAYAGVSNYEVESNLYRVNGEDPQLYLKFQKNIGGMNLYCYSNTGEDLPVQVFYAKAGELIFGGAFFDSQPKCCIQFTVFFIYCYQKHHISIHIAGTEQLIEFLWNLFL